MTSPKTNLPEATRALLIGIRDDSARRKGMTAEEAESLAKELSELAKTLQVTILQQITVRVRESQPKYGLGNGKAEEIAALAKELEADCLIFDQDISPSQQRNWEELVQKPVLDRQEVIIGIFAARAKTREATLQVELARLTHSLPRLSHSYLDLSQQRGGHYGSKGAGETKLELDRRTIEKRIHLLEEELEEVRRHRATQRKKRERDAVPSCALIGYTNAGKSMLLNALTMANTLVENKLFATLDPTTRRLQINRGQTILISDTVGFIRRLPHNLIDAFRSTLEEALQADLLVHVLDAADPDIDSHYDTTMSVLKDLNADQAPMIVALNKSDLVSDSQALASLQKKYTEAVVVSAATGSGLDTLLAKIEKSLAGTVTVFRFPVSRHDLVALLHREATVLEEQYEETWIEVKAKTGEKLSGQLKEYAVR